MAERALLVLEDGTWFEGQAYGAAGQTLGELVFNSSMAGYQEALTDPASHGQIVVMTAPHIGNTGLNDQDAESRQIWVSGYVVRSPARRWSNWQGQRSLADDLAAQGVVGIAEVDTRAVTLRLRESGTLRAGIFSGPALVDQRGRVRDATELVDVVLSWQPEAELSLADAATTAAPYVVEATGQPLATVVVVDLGMTASTLSLLAGRGLTVQVVPADTSFEDIVALEPDGVFFSSGPGDPAATAEVDLLRAVLSAGLPFFGVGLGHQLLGRALGFDTYRLHHGHHGLGMPVRDLATDRILITTHNHDFAVRLETGQEVMAPYADGRFGRVRVSHLSLNDDVVEGLECLDRPASSVQFQPESATGPREGAYLLDRFAALLTQ